MIKKQKYLITFKIIQICEETINKHSNYKYIDISYFNNILGINT